MLMKEGVKIENMDDILIKIKLQQSKMFLKDGDWIFTKPFFVLTSVWGLNKINKSHKFF